MRSTKTRRYGRIMTNEPIDSQLDNFLVTLAIQFYGDLLKVSRARGVLMTLPDLRAYLVENPYIRSHYLEGIKSEQEGQGLLHNGVLSSLISAQLKAFETGDHKNTRMYSEEIKKMITEGSQSRETPATLDDTGEVVSLVDTILKHPLEVDITKITTEDANAVREILMNTTDGFEQFSKWCFMIQMRFRFQMQDYHSIMFEFCQKIVNGEIDRGIVTIPPRHSKTQILSIFLPLYSFCYNPTSHNIITSYADDIVAESSGYIRQIMLDELFQKIFPSVRIDPSKRSLERWGTTKSGVMHAVPTGGKMTGKGAGSLSPVYSGVFVVDDAIKPKDANSTTIRQEINDRYDNTFMSRLANDGEIDDEDGNAVKCARTPIVLIMQRVHDYDLVGHLLRGKSSDEYVWLNIPALVTEDIGCTQWYDKIIKKQGYTHAIPYLYDLNRGEGLSALWPARKSLESLLKMQKAIPYTFNSQYLGDPTARGTGLIQESWWKEYDELPTGQVTKTFMTGDTASTKESYSDYSVIMYWAMLRDGRLMMIDAMVGKYETPELITEVVKFWEKHNKLDLANPTMIPTALYLEDKSSGQFLNQQFIRDGSVRTLPVPRDKTAANDKIARFLNAVPYFGQERIWFPREHKHIAHIVREIMGFTGGGSTTGHDDVIDNVSDAAMVAFSNRSPNYENWV